MSVIQFNAKRNINLTLNQEQKYKWYERVIERFTISHKEIGEWTRDDIKKMIFLGVKYIQSIQGADKRETGFYTRKPMERFEFLDTIVSLIGLLKPMELTEIFPVRKSYDGEQYQSKDYYYTMEAIRKLDQGKPIGEEVFKLLYDYENWSLKYFMVELITTMNLVNMYHGEADAFDYLFDHSGTTETKNAYKFTVIMGGVK